MKVFSIKEASNILNISQHTLRYYEKIGIIKINRRNETNIREFTVEDIKWLKYIRNLKEIGFTLEEIKTYSVLKKDDSKTLTKRKNILREHHKKIIGQISLLENIKKNIEDKVSCIENREDNHEN